MPRTLTDLINEIPLHNLRFHDAETIISRDEAGRIAERLNAHPGEPVTVNTDRGPMQVVSSGPVTYGLDYMVEFCADPDNGEFVQVILRSNPEEEFSVPLHQLPRFQSSDYDEFEAALEPIIRDYWQQRHGRRLDRCRLRGVGRSGYDRRYIDPTRIRRYRVTVDASRVYESMSNLSAASARAGMGLNGLRAEYEQVLRSRMEQEAEMLANSAFIGEMPRARASTRTYSHQTTPEGWEPNKWEA